MNNMLRTATVLAILALPAAGMAAGAHASAVPPAARMPAAQAGTGNIQCCEAVGSASDPQFTGVLQDLGINPAGLTGDIAFNCAGLTVIGTGSSCAQNRIPVVCGNDKSAGLIETGCAPVNVTAGTEQRSSRP